jgi:hypothetical protein
MNRLMVVYPSTPSPPTPWTFTIFGELMEEKANHLTLE